MESQRISPVNLKSRIQDLKNQQDAYFLWPDRLRWDFFVLALLISAPIISNSFIAFITFFSISTLFPWLIFYFFRIPLLDYLDKLPPSIHNAIYNAIEKKKELFCLPFKEIIRKVKTSYQNKECYKEFLRILSSWLLLFFPFQEQWDQVYYSPNGSFKERLIRIALIEMHQQQDNEDLKTTWLAKSFSRWLIYWCSPIWTGYLMLWITTGLIFLTLPDSPCSLCFCYAHPPSSNLFFSSILWSLYSIYFIRKEATEFARWTSLSRNDESSIPPSLLATIKKRSYIVDALTDEKIKMISSIVAGFASATYISAIRFFIFPV